MKKHKKIIALLVLFLSLSSTAQARLLTVNFDVSITKDVREGLGCSSNTSCYFNTNSNLILPVSMKLEIDNPVVDDSGGDWIIGHFGKPIIDSPLNSVWNKLADYNDWTLVDNSSSLFTKTAISTNYIPQPYYIGTEFYNTELIKLNGQVKENGARFLLNNAFFSYNRNMSGDDLISYLENAKVAIYNQPFEAMFSSREYSTLIINGQDYGWTDFSKPFNGRYLSGTARISSLSVSEVPLPPSFLLMLSSLLGVLVISNIKQ